MDTNKIREDSKHDITREDRESGMESGKCHPRIALYSTATGTLVAHILASVAQYEREVISERILAGQAAAKVDGKSWGGRKPGTKIKVNADKIKVIKHMLKAGESYSAIARATGLSRPTIYSVISSLAS